MTLPSSPPLPPLVSADWVVAALAAPTPELRFLDCRALLSDPAAGEQAYRAGHLPGAIYADLGRLSGPLQPGGVGGRHPLPEPGALAGWLGEVGIGPDSRVICYDDPLSGQGFYATRAWWLLRWLGHGGVQVLDGGWPAYRAAGGPVSTEAPAHPPQTFTARVQPGFVASAQEVAGRSPDTALIDARAPERYRGETEPLDARAGHIPGALNRPFSAAFGEDGRFLDPEAQAARLGVGGRPTIGSCGSGLSATPNLLARELAGVPLGPDNRLYAGSWSDWVSDPSRPVAVGPEES